MRSFFLTRFSDWGFHQRIWALAWPLMVSNLTVPILGLVDTAVVGHLDSAYYLGGVAISSTLFMVLYFAFNFLRMGTTGIASQHFGRSNSIESCLHVLWHGLLLALLCGLTLIVLQQPILETGLFLLGGSSEVQRQAQIYSEIRLLGAPAALSVYVIVGWLIGVQKTRGPLWILLFANILNIVLDILLVVVWDFKVAGVAWATVTADYGGLLFGLWLVRKWAQQQEVPAFQISRQLLLSMIVVNRDIFLRTAILLLVFGFFTAQGARISDSILAANAVLINFLLIISNALDGFANAAEALCGEAKGQKSSEQLDKVVRYTGLWSLLFAFILCGVFALAGTGFITLLTDIQEVATLANAYLVWIVILPLTAATCFWLDGVYIGLTMSRQMRDAMFLATVFVFIPVWFLTTGYLNHGLWLAMNAWMAARGGFMFVLLIRHRRLV